MSLKPVGRMCLRGPRTSQGSGWSLDCPAMVWGALGKKPKCMPEVESGARNTSSSVVPAPLHQCRPRRRQAWTPRMSQVCCVLDLRSALACQVKTAFRGGRVLGE